MRPRLDELLQRVPASRLTLVSAPAGFGKTTVLADWLATRGSAPDPAAGNRSEAPRDRIQAAWLSLDAGDNDPARFLRYLIAALQTIAPSLGATAVGGLAGPRPAPARSVVSSLIADLAQVPSDAAGRPGDPAGSWGDLIVVLDDYHVITAPPVHEAVTSLLDHGPSSLHLIIATRADPPLPVARLRSRGELLELRAEDLRFTREEAADFLAASLDPALSTEQVAALAARTEGWISGLVLAAISLRGRSGVQGFIDGFTGSHRHVFDYLVTEVLSQQPAEVQAFLEQTSIAERLCGSLGDALTGRADSQGMLEHLEASNLFLVPLDAERRWYRYHRLFADLLRTRLRRNRADLVPSLRARASEWCEANGDMDQAIEQALAAKDWGRAGRLIEANAQSYAYSGRLSTVVRWTEALPQEAAAGRPGLALELAMARVLAGRPAQAEPFLRQTELVLDGGAIPQAHAARMRTSIALMRAYGAIYAGDPARALDLLRGISEPAEDSLWERYNYYWMAGYASRFCGRLAEAIARFTEALRLGRILGNPWAIVMPLGDLANTSRLAGKLHQAAAYYRETLRSAAECGAAEFPYLGRVEAGLANVLLEQNRVDDALELAREAARKAPGQASSDHVPWSQVSLARVLVARGDLRAAAAALQVARDSLARAQVLPMGEALVDTSQVRLWLAQGNLAAAERWAANLKAQGQAEARGQAPGAVETGEIDEGTEMRLTTLVRVLLARAAGRKAQADRGTLDEAESILEVLRRTEARERVNSHLEILVLKALFHSQKAATRRSEAARAQDLAAALSALEASLALAAPEGYTRLFLDEGAPMAQLLTELVARQPEVTASAKTQVDGADTAAAYAAHLLGAFPPDVLGRRGIGSSLPERLTGREVEVLRLLAAGLANREIATKLNISEATTKTHVHNLLRKLEVKGRTHALVRARELGLV